MFSSAYNSRAHLRRTLFTKISHLNIQNVETYWSSALKDSTYDNSEWNRLAGGASYQITDRIHQATASEKNLLLFKEETSFKKEHVIKG